MHLVKLASEAVGQLGGLGPVSLQVGAGFLQRFTLGRQAGISQLQRHAPNLGPHLGQSIRDHLGRWLAQRRGRGRLLGLPLVECR